MRTLYFLLLTAILFISGCASGQDNKSLPYKNWEIGLLAPNYMEAWVESVDVVDQRGLAFERVHGGTVAIQSPTNNTGNPAWPSLERVGSGKSKDVPGIELPEMLFVRWQSLVEPKTYNVRIDVPQWVRDEMIKPHEIGDCGRKDRRLITDYRSLITIGLAPGGIAKIWLQGSCLNPVEVGRYEGKVSKEGPDLGQNNGQYAYPITSESKAYIEKFGIPYGIW
jgi:hypothetical protein